MNQPEQLQRLALLRDDFKVYAPECLKIKTKAGNLRPLVLNKAQEYIHYQLENQKSTRGWVRALVLKGRQQGASTYIGGRFYHKVTLNTGLGVYILTHEQAATDNLFTMANRYHDNSPLRPETGKSNAKELSFPKLDAGYTVGTAGVKAGGRSRTIQLFHGSEVAFWPNAADQFSGVVQTVPDLPGTEIILESTANGVTGEFYDRWQKAEAGVGDYIAIFVPWFWDEGYRTPPPPDFQLRTAKVQNEDMSEREYAESHGLEMDQMYWRRRKVEEVGHVTFKQEYPATSDEAFQTTGHDSFIKPAPVLMARKNKGVVPIGALVVGADPSRYGDDRFSIAWRRTRAVLGVERRQKIGTVEAAHWLRRIVQGTHRPGFDIGDGEECIPKKLFIDAGGGGAQIYDVLISFGPEFEEIVELVNFGDEPEDPIELLESGGKRPGPKNRRAEMWKRSKLWLEQPGGCSIPDEGVLQADACSPGYKYDTNQRLLLESKDQMRTRGARSPDDWDAIALTFASQVYGDDELTARKARDRGIEAAARRNRVSGRRGWMGV